MNHRERILAAIRRQPVDCVPTDLWATVEVQARLADALRIDEMRSAPVPGIGLLGGKLMCGVEGIRALFDRLDIDGILSIAPPYVGPPVRTEPDYWENA